MKTTLSESTLQKITGSLHSANAEFAARYPGESGLRQPVHTVYVGAHLFKSDTAVRLGSLAVRSFEPFAPGAHSLAEVLRRPDGCAETIYEPGREKPEREPVEDFRID